MAVKSDSPGTDIGYELTVSLNLDIRPWLQIMTDTMVKVNICLKYYQHPLVMVRTRREHKDS